jgi:2-polyprenyl-3-methyl-5-hydroxy-6-metoxy-1,4-benzoquinol methylase
MPVFLRERRTNLRERMDREDADLATLYRTYDGFQIVNPLLARWKRIYRKWMLPSMKSGSGTTFSVLDIGCGGCDVIRSLVKWAAADGFTLNASGIDPDERTATYVALKAGLGHIHFRQCHSRELVNEGLTFDFVLSNHVLHHLNEQEFNALLVDAQQLSRRLVLFNDIERGDIAWIVFNLTWPFFFRSFITPDGLTSIRRSYTLSEMKSTLPMGWTVSRLFPYRLVVRFAHNAISEVPYATLNDVDHADG